MTTSELAHKLAISRIHAWRLARSGVVPATRRTKGGHFYFVECPKLTKWINYTAIIGSKHRKKEMTRAYRRHYGNTVLERAKDRRHFMFVVRRAFNRAKVVNLGRMSSDEFFDQFNYDIIELTKMLDFLDGWRDQEIKKEMVQMSGKKLWLLKKRIDKWLNRQ